MTFVNLRLQISNRDEEGMQDPKADTELAEEIAAELSEREDIHAVTVEPEEDIQFKDGEVAPR